MIIMTQSTGRAGIDPSPSREDLRAQSCGRTCHRRTKVSRKHHALEGFSPDCSSSVFPIFFSLFSFPTVSTASLGLPLTLCFLGTAGGEARASDTGGNSQPRPVADVAKPGPSTVPRSPRPPLPPGLLPLASRICNSECQVDLGLEPS